MERFEDRVVLITGASSGIGAATVKAFAAAGARILFCDVQKPTDPQLLELLQGKDAPVQFEQADVSIGRDVKNLIGTAIDSFGRLDFAFNNAGIEGIQSPTAQCSEENWDRTLNINLKGVWLCMKYELLYMADQGAGVIINNSSVAGLTGFANLGPYVAAKHGIIGLTKSAALEYAIRGIRVNAVCPGVIRTPMVDRVIGEDIAVEAQYIAMEPAGRLGTVEEVAQTVLWLCSPHASFITGHAMVVDGGMLAGI